jgi:hypothetical protein
VPPNMESSLAWKYLAEQLAKLPRKKRLAFETLSSHGQPKIDQDRARWGTNSFKTEAGSGLFLKHARFNHGCVFSKNIFYTWNSETELLGSYSSQLMSFLSIVPYRKSRGERHQEGRGTVGRICRHERDDTTTTTRIFSQEL